MESPSSRVGVSEPVTARSKPVTALAWIAMLLASNLPTIIWQAVTGGIVPIWLLVAQECALVALLLLTWLARPFAPLRGYLLTLLVVSSAFVAYSPLSQSAFWQAIDRDTTWWQDALLRQAPTVIGAIALALTLIGSRLTRRDLALAPSDPQAIAQRDLVILNFPRRPWRRAANWYVTIITGLMLLYLFRHTALPPDAGPRWAMSLPGVLALAALNTVNEEFQYRQVPLARLHGVVGGAQALWLTALLFGISHFYGQPSGYIGVALATWFGYLQAKNMEESRGSTWAYLLHFAQDVVIFSFVALV